MKKIIVLLSFHFVFIFGFSQNFNFDIHKNKLSDFIKMEQQFSSELIENKSLHMIPIGVAQPLTYKRKENKIPDLLIQYFYFKKDSSIYAINYDWDDSILTGFIENKKKSKSEVLFFIEKYQEIYAELSKKYGISKREGDIRNTNKIKMEGMDVSDTWSPNDSTK